jgi:anti-anti-sigma factor
MEIITQKHENGLVVSVKGRIDAVSAPAFEKELMEFVDSGDTSLIINCRELIYLTSAGLRGILTVAKKLKNKGGALKVAALIDVVKNVYEISGFSAIIPTFDTVEAALETDR